MLKLSISRSSKVLFAAALASFASLATGAVAQTKLNIGYATATDFLPAFIAKDEGCFDKHKIDATLTRMPIVGNIPGALMANSLQIGMSTPTVLLQAKEGGLDLVAVAGATRMVKDNVNISLVTRKGTNIKAAADLKGKKVGVPGINSVIDVTFRKWLKNNNVKIEDVTFIETPFPQMPDLLKGGTLDAVIAVEPIRSRIVAGGIGDRFPEEFYVAVNPDTMLAFWIATADWAKGNAETLKNFRACMNEGLAFIKSNPDKAKEIEKKYLGFNTPVMPTMTADMKAEDFTFFVGLGKELGLIRKDIDVKTLVAP